MLLWALAACFHRIHMAWSTAPTVAMSSRLSALLSDQ